MKRKDNTEYVYTSYEGTLTPKASDTSGLVMRTGGYSCVSEVEPLAWKSSVTHTASYFNLFMSRDPKAL